MMLTVTPKNTSNPAYNNNALTNLPRRAIDEAIDINPFMWTEKKRQKSKSQRDRKTRIYSLSFSIYYRFIFNILYRQGILKLIASLEEKRSVREAASYRGGKPLTVEDRRSSFLQNNFLQRHIKRLFDKNGLAILYCKCLGI
jgi:hypothetical protein